MKKLSKLALAAVGALSLLLVAGCSNISGNVDSEEVTAFTASVTGSSKDISFASADSSASRTILPDTQYAENLKFYLTYKKQSETNYSLYGETGAVTVKQNDGVSDIAADSSTTSGTLTISLASAAYDFILYAVPSSSKTQPSNVGEMGGYAVLAAQTQADLSRGDKIAFNLKSDNTLLTGKGNVLIYLYTAKTDATATEGWDASGYTVTAQIESLDDGTVQGSAVPISELPRTTPDSLTKDKVDATNATFSSSGSITAGTYNFVVKFEDTANNVTYEWSDHIIINANADTKDVIAIPKVVLEKPAAPTYLYATYTEPESAAADTYQTQLYWDDQSNNESYFELQFAELPSAATAALPTSDDTWKTSIEEIANVTITRYGVENTGLKNEYTTTAKLGTSTGYSEITNFYGTSNSKWASGSLNKNNEVIVMNLPLGKRYEARISAVNAAGRSDWVYATLGSTSDLKDLAGTETTATHTKALAKSNAFTRTVAAANGLTDITSTTAAVSATSSSSINLYRMTYDVDGGTFYTSTDTKTEGGLPAVYSLSDSKIVNYYNEGSIAILNPNGDGSTDGDTVGEASSFDTLYLAKTSKVWTNWVYTPVDSTENSSTKKNYNEYGTAPAPYTGFDNITLTADYATLATFTITNASDEELSTVTAESGDAKADTKFAFDKDTKTITADKTSKTLTYTVTYDAAKVKYNSITVYCWPTSDDTSKTELGSITSSGGKVVQNLEELDVGSYMVSIVATTDNNSYGYTYNIVLNITNN